jgi:uncharacterized protein (TIGR03437 family)
MWPRFGKQGTQVSLTGTGLGGASTVTFDGRPATILSNTATRIVAAAPAGTKGEYATVVVQVGGASADAPGTFQYPS